MFVSCFSGLPMRSTVPTANPPPVCEGKKTTIIHLFFLIISHVTRWRHFHTVIQCEALELLLSSFSLVMVGKSQVLLITVRMAPFYSKVPVCYDSVTISTRGHEMEKAKFSNHSFYFFLFYLMWHINIIPEEANLTLVMATTTKKDHW